jgi:hypothetical protein
LQQVLAMLGTYLCRSEGGLLDTNVDTSNTVRSVKYPG